MRARVFLRSARCAARRAGGGERAGAADVWRGNGACCAARRGGGPAAVSPFALVFALPAFLLALVLAVALVVPSPAWADDESVDPGNLVNPQQLPDSSFIYDASISDLEKADSYMDGQTVQVTGEVVGDRINAELDSDHCWLTLQATDGSYAEVTVFVTTAAAGLVDTFGAYGKRGTVLQVRGTFNLACDEHEGLTDLHADHVSVVSSGAVEPDEFNALKFVPGAVLLVVGLVLVLVFFRMRESRR